VYISFYVPLTKPDVSCIYVLLLRRGCSKWKEAKAGAATRAQIERGRRDGVSTRLHAPKSAPSMPTPEQEALGSGWNHVVQGGRIVKAQATSSPTPKNEPETQNVCPDHDTLR
jgi:hypothetical protein